jgi:crotonobetainyl-CoA:carnitine CoA-transferase CaiB-like acyl-CoA transferase
MTHGALAGVRVVDLSRVLAGPLCTQLLADHGADVVKVEPPQGDETRSFGPPFDPAGNAAYFGAVNRGKRALTLDLARDEARRILLRLVGSADVLVENFLPGTMERWGLGYEALAERDPRLVYCSISGFGREGPLGGLPGYDAVLQAMTGIMSINGTPESGPTRVGVPVVDHLTGYVAVTGILMALVERERSGRGQRVEATLFDTGLSLLVPHAANWFLSGNEPGLMGSAHPNIAPYDKFAARDGEIFLGVANDGQFRRLCGHLGRPDLADEARFASNGQRVVHRDALRGELERLLAGHEREALCRDLMRLGVPAGPVHRVSEAVTQPHALHRSSVLQEGAAAGLRSPVRFSRSRDAGMRGAPRRNEHMEEVLAQAGYSAAEIELFKQSGVTGERATGQASAPTRRPA